MLKITRTYVVDASVALKWYLDDEEYIHNARKILRNYGDRKIEIIVPDFFLVEVGNALNVAVRRGRLEAGKAFDYFQHILELDIPVMGCSGFLVSAWEFAREYDRSVYDSLYVAMADTLNHDFCTGDKKLYNALRDRLTWVRWIGDYDGETEGNPG